MARQPPITGSNGCNRCGDCCRVVVLARPKTVIAHENTEPDTKRWARDDLVRISHAEAKKVRPHLERGGFLYRCRQFDDENNACTIHDTRKPKTCTGFPWYGKQPGTESLHHWCLWSLTRCSYWLDLPVVEVFPAHVKPEPAT